MKTQICPYCKCEMVEDRMPKCCCESERNNLLGDSRIISFIAQLFPSKDRIMYCKKCKHIEPY